jgi:hypothetical protein
MMKIDPHWLYTNMVHWWALFHSGLKEWGQFCSCYGQLYFLYYNINWPSKTFPRQVETKWLPCSFLRIIIMLWMFGYSSTYSSLFVFIHKVPKAVFSNLHSKPTIVQSHSFVWTFRSVIVVSILYLTRLDS